MREHQVPTPSLHVERVAQIVGRDRGALHVPARPAGAERRRPRRLTGPLGQPDHRVQRVLLPRPTRIAAAPPPAAPPPGPATSSMGSGPRPAPEPNAASANRVK